MTLTRRVVLLAISIASSIALAYSLFGLGFAVCTTPQATQAVGGTFSGWQHSTYPEQDMAQIAEAVRSFSIEGTSSEDLYATINGVIEQVKPALASVFEAGSIAESGVDPAELGSKSLSQLEEHYSLPQDALTHLQDCTPIFTTGRISTGVVGAFGLVGLVALGILAGRTYVGRCLLGASLLVIAVLIALGIWAAVDFDGLFTWMHTLFFAQGSWLFDANSLLITLFPEAFWAAMAGLWIISSLVFAAIAGAVGKILAR